jgi:CMP-N-acetylneuraminic acid synthetase
VSAGGDQRLLAIIPARGGSKGVPRKNLRLLGGIPLVAHSILAAQRARTIHTLIVSTDDAEIAAVAREHGAEIVQRPAELADDRVQNNAVMRHAIEKRGSGFTYVALLQPTSPLKSAGDIDACLAPLLAGEARSVMTVTPVEHHPDKVVRLEKGLVLPYTTEAGMEARRQDLQPLFRQNGAVYGLSIVDFLREDRLYLPPCRASIMRPEDSVDIDSELDLLVAEQLLQQRKTP